MRFTDPLITLWHVGGGIPTHVGMAMYSFRTQYRLETDLSYITDKECFNKYAKIDISDI
jgi:hypothetical protein